MGLGNCEKTMHSFFSVNIQFQTTIIYALEKQKTMNNIHIEDAIMTAIIPLSHTDSCGCGSVGTLNTVSGSCDATPSSSDASFGV